MTMNGKRCVLHRHAHARRESADGEHQCEPFYIELLSHGLSELKYVFIHILLNICSVIYCNFFFSVALKVLLLWKRRKQSVTHTVQYSALFQRYPGQMKKSPIHNKD